MERCTAALLVWVSPFAGKSGLMWGLSSPWLTDFKTLAYRKTISGKNSDLFFGREDAQPISSCDPRLDEL